MAKKTINVMNGVGTEAEGCEQSRLPEMGSPCCSWTLARHHAGIWAGDGDCSALVFAKLITTPQ